LETDEVLYAEKIDELNEVQSRYDNLVRDSEQLKQLWEAGQRTEETLRREVERLSKRVTELEAMEKEREQGTQNLREKEEEEIKEDTKLSTVEQEGYRLHTDQQVEVGYSQKYHSQTPSEGLAKSMEEREEAEESMSCLHLLKGKVRTDREEDLSDEAVLQSLQTLTSLLVHHHSYHHQHHTLTGPGTRGVALETSSCEPALSKSGTVSPGLLNYTLTDSTHVYTCIQFTRRNTCSCIHSHRAHINHTKSYTDVLYMYMYMHKCTLDVKQLQCT
jgi:hypothetical protein